MTIISPGWSVCLVGHLTWVSTHLGGHLTGWSVYLGDHLTWAVIWLGGQFTCMVMLPGWFYDNLKTVHRYHHCCALCSVICLVWTVVFTSLLQFNKQICPCLCRFPFYYILKLCFILWLVLPATKGSSLLYRKVIHPQLLNREKVGIYSSHFRLFI